MYANNDTEFGIANQCQEEPKSVSVSVSVSASRCLCLCLCLRHYLARTPPVAIFLNYVVCVRSKCTMTTCRGQPPASYLFATKVAQCLTFLHVTVKLECFPLTLKRKLQVKFSIFSQLSAQPLKRVILGIYGKLHALKQQNKTLTLDNRVSLHMPLFYILLFSRVCSL